MSNKTDSGDLHMDKHEKQEEINNLYQILYRRDQAFQRAKGKRTIKTVLIFAAFYFVTIMIANGYTSITTTVEAIFSKEIFDIIGIALASIFLASLHFFLNGIIFGQLFNIGRDESDVLESIRKRIRELEKTDPH
jgi:hypothetical protein